MHNKVGISSFALRYAIDASTNPLDPIGVLETAAVLGAEVVQICDNLPLAPLSDPELDALARRAADLGLELEVGTRGSGPARAPAGIPDPPGLHPLRGLRSDLLARLAPAAARRGRRPGGGGGPLPRGLTGAGETPCRRPGTPGISRRTTGGGSGIPLR
jgi:hypothetical protein